MLRCFLFWMEKIKPWHQAKIDPRPDGWEASSCTLGGDEGKVAYDKVEETRRKVLIKPLKKINRSATQAFSDP